MAEHKRIKVEPLDEKIHMRPEVIDWWQFGQNEFPNPHFPNDERIMHHYFRELPDPSPFDHTSNNGVIFKQAESNYEPWRTVHDRKAFEAALRKLKGSEYVIVGEPQQIPNEPPGAKNGMWVFRKQDRSGDKASDGEYKEVETLGTYYFLGLQGFQAPSVLDVVENRLLNTTTSLNKVFGMAKKLPSFSPTTGYTYEVDTKKATPASGSTAASPTRSREGSVAPGLESQSLRSGYLASGGQASNTSQADDGGLLWSSLNMAVSYADDYIDENPLEGEPGKFKFATSKSAIQRRREEDEAAAKKAREQKEAASRAASAKPSPLPAKAPSPPAIFTEAKTGKSEKKRKEEKKQRRKSRPNATTPATPASATGNGPPPPAG
ncbi:hypothetical protein EJ03DRAFT_326098 [Teratosphaeria nubilosa]|uniref:Mediator of RNA polymerase II transcription subunit 6 n=1 Tax=Teratosphaeria nubilosa TaxID=161662 RepID=A0A6G1LE97_9PEZI|nr:hypothetical protein EJ03DRAFT_326098 [Teratosphaeria nubilosa]